MFKWLKVCLSILMVTTCLMLSAQAGLTQIIDRNSEYIQRMDVSIDLAQDQTATITEHIEYHFPQNQNKHGIYRDIPEEYHRNGNNYSLRYRVTRVTRNGLPEPYQVLNMGDKLRIKIGRGDVFVTDTHTYEITYQTQRALNTFADHRELYWNVTGNEWTVPILNAQATVRGPTAVKDSRCYTGVYGSSEENCTKNTQENGIAVSADDPLEAREGLTIVVAYPRQAFSRPPLFLSARWFIQDNPIVLLPLATLLVMITLWRLLGRDPKGRGTLIPHYEEPRGLSAGLLSALYHQAFGWSSVTATILDLARRGYLRIVWQGNSQYYFLRLKAADRGLHDYEEIILRGLFPRPQEDSTTPKSLQSTFPAVIKRAASAAFRELKTYGFMHGNPESVRARWLKFVAIFSTIAILGGGFIFGLLGFIAGFTSSFITLIFAWYMPKTTKEGAIAAEEVRGLQWYMKVSEKERLKFHDAPQKKPDDFSRFLPAAVALGVAHEWANQFNDIMIQSPDYLSGISKVGSALQIVNTIDIIQSQAVKSMYQVAAKSGSFGSSGSTGLSGGFSGGGFGGGGGGSW